MRKGRRAVVRAQVALVAALAGGGCGELIGIHDPAPAPGDAGISGTGQPDGAGPGARDAGGSLSADAAVGVDPDLVLWFGFDETGGTVAADSAAWRGVQRNAHLETWLAGSAGFSTNRQVGLAALDLTAASGGGGYVIALPSPGLQDMTVDAVTISCWVLVRRNQDWQRIFDFGAGDASLPDRYMFLTTNQAYLGTPGGLRFTITDLGLAGEQTIDVGSSVTLPLATWHHVAVVLPAGAVYTGSLYVDGQVAGSNSSMTLHPASLGSTDRNYLGRSTYPSDPFFDGEVDDVRIYRRALGAAEISSLARGH